MTDPQWLMKKFDLKFKTPSLDNLKVESEVFFAQYHKLIVQGLLLILFYLDYYLANTNKEAINMTWIVIIISLLQKF